MKLTNNLFQHQRKKHIDVRHHFIRDHQQKGDIGIESVGTEDQLADLFTKPIYSGIFEELKRIFSFTPMSRFGGVVTCCFMS
jgi:hypothetical protein